MYKLYTDKIENFEAVIKLEGASPSKSKARLVVESDNFSLLFKGKVDSNGKVTIPVRRLKGLLDENTKGTIKLEVIAEDTYFTPWESEFQVDTSKKITVEIKSQSAPIIESGKPKLKVKVMNEQRVTKSETEHVINIVKLLIRENINIKNLSIKKNKLNNIVAEYINENIITTEQKAPVIQKVIKVLEKRK
tara:strand:- start:15576 stop:16148 length:573 start_codon:yes stop_codon:yes gene_type:complete